MTQASRAMQDLHLRLSRMRAELLAPANAIRRYCELLCDEARAGSHGVISADLEAIRGSAEELYAIVESLLDPNLARELFEDDDMAASKRRLRHDLRLPITAIKGYSELMLAEVDDIGAASLRQCLLPLTTEAGRLLAQVDAIVDFHTTATMQGELARSFAEAEDSGDHAPAPGRILVVDDDATSRALLARHLALEGHEVVLAENGAAAFRALETEAVDLILLDLLMQHKNGFDVLLDLKHDDSLREIPVVMITAVTGDDSARRCIAAGADDYLPKPCETEMLRARINACLRRKRWHDLRRPSATRTGQAIAATSQIPPAHASRDGLSARDRVLKQELENVLAEAAALVARNRHLTSRSIARLLAGSGRHRFRERTLRKIVDHRYPPLYRLGVLSEGTT